MQCICDMVNHDIDLWVSELMRATQRYFSAVFPSPAGTVFDPPPMPAFLRTLEFCRGGGEALLLVLSSIASGADGPTKRKATALPTGSPGSKGKANSSLPRVCLMFARTGKGNWSACMFLHEPPATSASSPSPPTRREEGGGSVAAAGGRSRADGRVRHRCGRSSPRGTTWGSKGVEALVLVMDEDTGPAARWGKPLRAQLRRRRWMYRLRQHESGGRVLGSTSGGAAAALVVGGEVASTVDVDGTPTVRAARRVTDGFRRRSLEAQAGEGGVGRDRVPVAPGSVIFGNIGDHGERARSCTIVSSRIVRRAYRSRAEIQLAIAIVCDVRI